MTRLAFVDLETTGLDPKRHEPYEIAIITDDGTEHSWWLPVDLSRADSNALRISRYYERHPPDVDLDNPSRVASDIARLTAGAHLVGMVPSFDAAFLTVLLQRHGLTSAWHYHIVDCEALAAGHLRQPPPWKSDELSRAAGVEPPGPGERHGALADARWAKRLYVAILP